MNKIILFIFAGRRVNMEIQWPYLDRLLSQYPQMELHLWDLTREAADAEYLRTLEGAHAGRVQVLRHLHTGHPIRCLYPKGKKRLRGYPPCRCMNHKPPYEEPYRYYAKQGETFTEHNWAGNEFRYDTEADTIYVKMDDDVLFLETDHFEHLVYPLREHPERIISANVINNAVCAKYQWDALATANRFAVGNPEDWDNDKRWWALHENPDFAVWAHRKFISWPPWEHDTDEPTYVRTRPGEAVSINCIAFTHQTMRRIAAYFAADPRLGDEGAVDKMLPWIAMNFHAAHLTFGPQDQHMAPAVLDGLRADYTRLAKEYLT